MAKRSCDINNVYKEISTINNYFSEYEATSGVIVQTNNPSINKYCHYGNNSGNGNCNNDYFRKASSGVIYLLKNLKDKCDLEYDKIAEYAILWLSYKLHKKPKNNFTNLNEFYTKYIVNNNDYNKVINDNDSMTYKDIIDKNKDLMNIKEISKFYEAFNILFSSYNLINANKLDCTKHSSYAKNFADKFKDLNNDSNNIKDSPFSQILSTLSGDYNNLKKIYHDKDKSCDFPDLPKIEPKEIYVENSGKDSEKSSGQLLGDTFEVTSSSSSILNTVIPGLSTFSVIPVFLGVAYKTIFKKQIKKTKEENET
ncbi:PIR protein CIR protein [Plasmodium vinckei vinckei]|uniref:PIR protein CIR protein n=1 Tax=Plasmodium vinckei vinckei TaxID=54757 RepID=A0A449BMQ4_PLAVN|nr:PIR protein CIR protein [Plasmodium vinckei vinckei]VEV54720.1 PIR protein CIR protein [Plasmodium vinckei vinckei]